MESDRQLPANTGPQPADAGPLFWDSIEPGAIVQLLTTEVNENGAAFAYGIVARLGIEYGQPTVVVYPFDPDQGRLAIQPSGLPKAATVAMADVCLYNLERRDYRRLRGECTLYIDREEGIPISARIYDLSVDGVGFTLGRPLADGQYIRLGFIGIGRQKGLIIAATVRSCAPHFDGRWRIGCQFEYRISDDELASFVA